MKTLWKFVRFIWGGDEIYYYSEENTAWLCYPSSSFFIAFLLDILWLCPLFNWNTTKKKESLVSDLASIFYSKPYMIIDYV